MRKAAGILMIIGAIMSAAAFGSIPMEVPAEPDESLGFNVMVALQFVYMGFTLSGGIFTLKRKRWKLCFTSSLLLTLFLISSLFFLPVTSTWSLLPGGVLPIIFVCLRKREWER